KADALEPEQARRYRLAAYQQQLAGLLSEREVRDWLRRIPAPESGNPQLQQQVVAHLIRLQAYDAAATLLAEALAGDDMELPELARELGQLAAHLSVDKRLALLKEADAWLKQRPRDHWLLLALGRLAQAQQLWGKAQNYLEASVSIQPTLCAHAELAKLFERRTIWKPASPSSRRCARTPSWPSCSKPPARKSNRSCIIRRAWSWP
ncbi:hypothetical protein PWG14_13725, partial (plasmid) [Chromobacterium amazonense]|nr:hypothetical protein [Chromobacterium amazonense]